MAPDGHGLAMRTIDVFADVACPFAHVGLRRFVAARAERGLGEPVLRVREWPLQLVNDKRHDGVSVAPKIAALRQEVAPDAFRSFEPSTFPKTSLPAMAAKAAAYRLDPRIGEAFSLSVRDALFEHGADVSDPAVLEKLAAQLSVPLPAAEDEASVNWDYEDGQRRGVAGSPHFFTADGSAFFCPSMDIDHRGDELDVSFDLEVSQRSSTPLSPERPPRSIHGAGSEPCATGQNDSNACSAGAMYSPWARRPVRARLRGHDAAAVNMGVLAVAVEDHDQLRWAADSAERVRCHGVELGRFACLDGEVTLAQRQADPPVEHEEPVPAGVHPRCWSLPCGLEAHLHRERAARWPVQHPRRALADSVGRRADDDIVVVVHVEQRIQAHLQGAGQRNEDVEADRPLPGLDPADGGRAQVRSTGQFVERVAERLAEAAQTGTHDLLDLV